MENKPITFLLTERAAFWIGYPIQKTFDWNNRNAPTQLKNYIGDGTTPDRVFTVTLKAKLILDMVRTLMDSKLQVGYEDYRSIVLNQPAVPGYTALQTQMVQKANGSSDEKETAQWLIDQYNIMKDEYKYQYDYNKATLIEWANN